MLRNPMFRATMVAAILTVPSQAAVKPAALPPVQSPNAVATVNGVPIMRRDIMDRLWRESGSVMTERFTNQLIVRSEARKRNLTVTPGEVQDRITEYRTAFMSFAGRQPNDWTELMNRLGPKNLDDDIAIQILTRKIGEYEGARTELTEAEKTRTLEDLERAAHTVKARQILVGTGPEFANRTDEQSLARANEALAKLNAGANWDDLAKEYSDDVSTREKGGALETVSRDQLNREFEDAAFALKAGETGAQPVKTPLGYVIIRVDERIDTPVTEEKKAETLAKLLQRKRDRVANPDGSGWFSAQKTGYKIITFQPWERTAVKPMP